MLRCKQTRMQTQKPPPNPRWLEGRNGQKLSGVEHIENPLIDDRRRVVIYMQNCWKCCVFDKTRTRACTQWGDLSLVVYVALKPQQSLHDLWPFIGGGSSFMSLWTRSQMKVTMTSASCLGPIRFWRRDLKNYHLVVCEICGYPAWAKTWR